MADRFADHFSQCYTVCQSIIQPIDMEVNCQDVLSGFRVGTDEIEEGIRNFKPKLSTGVDGIRAL